MRCGAAEATDFIKQMSGEFPDELIAGTVNRLGFENRRGQLDCRCSSSLSHRDEHDRGGCGARLKDQ